MQLQPLTQNALTQKEFALKKIRCPIGAEGVEEVMREVAAYRRFKYVFRLHSLYQLHIRISDTPTSSVYMCVGCIIVATRVDLLQDSAVLQDSDGESKIVYLFLPIYKARFSASRSTLSPYSDL